MLCSINISHFFALLHTFFPQPEIPFALSNSQDSGQEWALPGDFFDPPGHFGGHSDVQLKSSLHFFTFLSLNWQGHIVTPILCLLVSPIGL